VETDWQRITAGRCWYSTRIKGMTLAVQHGDRGFQGGVQGNGPLGDLEFKGPVRADLRTAQDDADLLGLSLLRFIQEAKMPRAGLALGPDRPQPVIDPLSAKAQ
jgi:hypothetical protein